MYLYKKGANGNEEARIEVEVSNILDKCNVRHLKYSKAMAMKRTDFHFTEGIEPEDFIVKSHYNSFMNRAKELGIKTYPGS